jgi:hypothetical protein
VGATAEGLATMKAKRPTAGAASSQIGQIHWTIVDDRFHGKEACHRSQVEVRDQFLVECIVAGHALCHHLDQVVPIPADRQFSQTAQAQCSPTSRSMMLPEKRTRIIPSQKGNKRLLSKQRNFFLSKNASGRNFRIARTGFNSDGQTVIWNESPKCPDEVFRN